MAETKKAIRETDLYAPVRDYLTAQGYVVRAEVRGCDITATRGDDLVIIELKCGFNTDLLVQATQRQRAADSVYVALPRPARGRTSERWRGVEHLLRRLEIGLILVSPVTGGVEIVFHPLPFDRKRNTRERRTIIAEIAGRSGDYNRGGSNRCKIFTAYRENALFVACCLERFGPLSPRRLRALGTGPKTLGILSRNVYGWFERVGRGLYGVRSEGRAALGEHPEIAAHCARKLDQRDGATGGTG